jgi:hypothetical protein
MSLPYNPLIVLSLPIDYCEEPKFFVMFISDGNTISTTFSAVPLSSRRYLFLLERVAKYIRGFPTSLQTHIKSVA